MHITDKYFKPLNSILSCNIKEIEVKPLTLLVIASYFTLIIPAAFLLLSCLKGRVSKNAPEGSPKVDKVAQQTLNQQEAKKLYDEGISYLQGSPISEANQVNAFKCFEKAANLGYTDASQELGYCYSLGIGTDNNGELALKHYLIASEAGNIIATFNLGTMYENGQGCDKDYAKAAFYYQKALDAGYFIAAYALASFYEEGLGVEKDEKKAFELIQNNSLFNQDNHVKLGEYFLFGVGCEKNLDQAKKIFSSFKNNPIALYRLGQMHLDGTDVAKDKKMAFELLSKAKELGSMPASSLLGYMYYCGFGTGKDEKKAFECMNLAYSDNQKSLYVIEWMATFYMRGVGTETHLEKARELVDKGNSIDPNNWEELYEELKLWEELQSQKNPEVLFKLSEKLAHEDKFYVVGFRLLKKAADLGNVDAQFHAGLAYVDGINVDKDLNLAKHYFTLAAEQGDEASMFHLGDLENDPKKTFEWYKKAASKGHAASQYYLGKCYVDGKGCDKDENLAFEQISRASLQGFSDATSYLGYMYYAGIGTIKNNDKAFECISQAYQQDPEDILILTWLGIFHMYGVGVEPDTKKARELLEKLKAINPISNLDKEFEELNLLEEFEKEENPEALFNIYLKAQPYPEISTRILKKAADRGHAEAQFHMGTTYFDEPDLARHYYLLAANQGYDGAMLHLGDMSTDPKDAFEWYKKGAEKGYAPAQFLLGVCLRTGRGCPKDLELAFDYLTKALNQGYEQAKSTLAVMYYFGEGTEIDDKRAFKLITEAYADVKTYDFNVVYWLGAFYMRGVGVESNPKKARELFEEGKALKPEAGWDVEFEELALWEKAHAEENTETLHNMWTTVKNNAALKFFICGKAAARGHAESIKFLEGNEP